MDPVTAAALIGAGSKLLGSIGGGMSARAKAQADAKEREKDRQFTRERDRQGLAADESMADPFRHTLAQMNAAQAFDQMANTRQKTVHIPGLNPKFAPKLGGGYQASDEMRGAANTARSAVLGGQGQAPTMTDPSNYGQTGVMNLLAMLQKAGLIPPGAGMNMAPTKPGGPSPDPFAPRMPQIMNSPGRGAAALQVASQRGTSPRMRTMPEDEPFALSF